MGGYMSLGMETVYDPTVRERIVLPEGSFVYHLVGMERGGFNHAVLLPGAVTPALVNSTVDEVWYFLSGTGQIWRKEKQPVAKAGTKSDAAPRPPQGREEWQEKVAEIKPGLTISIPVGTHFQFRNDSDQDLVFLVVCMPQWPNMKEARKVKGPWEPKVPDCYEERVKDKGKS